MIDARAVRMGVFGAVIAVVAMPLLGLACLAALWALSTFLPRDGHGPIVALDVLDTHWTFGVSAASLGQTAVLAALGFVLGVALARRRTAQPSKVGSTAEP